MVQTATADVRLTRGAAGQFVGNDISVATIPDGGAMRVTLSAPTSGIKRVHLRWNGQLSETRLIVGDAWERGYGDLEWRGWAADRVLPWYAMAC